MSMQKLNKNIEKVYSLSPLQEGMLYHQMLDEKSGSYVVQTSLKIKGDFSVDLANESIQLLALQHEALRTMIPLNRFRKPVQIVLKDRIIEFNEMDLQEYSSEEQETEIEKFLEQDCERGFDFEKSPNFRVATIRLSQDEWVMIWSFHHIIIDGWCLSILFEDYLNNYFALKKGVSKESIISTIKKAGSSKASYGDYINWLERKDKEEEYNYWDELLHGYDTDAKIQSFGNKEISDRTVLEFSIPFTESEFKTLKEKMATYNVTVSTLIETAWGLLLQSYSGSNDVVFGKVVSGRDILLPGVEETVGLFINTIPSRVEIDSDISCLELLHRMQKQGANSLDYQHCSLADIQSRSLNKSYIHSVYAFENYFTKEGFLSEQEGLSFEVIKAREQTNYPLTLRVIQLETLQLDMLYDPSLFSENDIHRILLQLKKISLHLALHPDSLVDSINSITDEEKSLVTGVFNNLERNYDEVNVKNIFEEMVAKFPNKTAVAFEDKEMSYEELNKKSNELAHKLLEVGVKKEEPIVILAERSLELIVGILGVLKAGACYVPIDHTYPKERIDFIVEDVGAKIALLGDFYYDFKKDLTRINLKDNKNYKNDSTNPNISLAGNNLAYVMYTSGTSGKPKGSLIEHKSIIRLVKDTNYIPFHEEIRILQTGSIAFDASTFEFFGSLLNGGTLYLEKQDTLTDVRKLSKSLKENKINSLFMTTSLFNQMLDLKSEMFKDLDNLLVGGEKLSNSHVRKFKSLYPDIKISNVYGPTENTTFTTAYEIPNDFDKMPIGKPITGTQVYIMNGDKLCGIGIPGELCITGSGVSRGYLNREELTQEQFVDNPFGEGKMYRSGDLVRWLPDGNIEFLGRIDQQVKVRGYRIELQEIVEVLNKQAGVKESVVIAKEVEEGDKVLLAYVVMEDKKELELATLKEGARKELPEYMMPSHIMAIDEIPLTVNGKIDIEDLPEIQFERQDEYIAPRNPTEKALCKIFEEVLAIKQVSVNDNFFELGGHSLRAMNVVNLIEEKLKKRIKIKSIFEYPTPETLSKHIEELEEGGYQPIPVAECKESYPMSSAQKRLFLINQMDEAELSYNMPACLSYTGKVDEEKVQHVVNELVKRHEAFRTSFHFEDEEAIQKIAAENIMVVEKEERDVSSSPEVYLEEFVRPFNLSEAPLLRVKTIKTKENHGYLLFDMHHIISDGMSMNILIEDFCQLYEGKELLSLDVQYKDYSEWMLTKDLEKQEEYWLAIHKEKPLVLDFPLDVKRPQLRSFKGDSVKKQIGKDITKELKSFTRREGYTDYMVMLGALMVCISKYSRQEDIIIGSSISGRTHPSTANIVGMFVNTLAMRGYPKEDKSIKDFLEEIKEHSLSSYENQEYPFEELVEKTVINRDLSRNPIFDIMFTLQNNEDVTFETKDFTLGSVSQKPVAKFDLDFHVEYGNGYYNLDLIYNNALFNKESIEILVKHYFNILGEIIDNPGKTIGEINLSQEAETLKILTDFNNTEKTIEKEKTVKELFEEAAKQNPNKIALVDGSIELSYEELNNKINHLANKLRSLGVKPGERVAILTQRSAAMMVGIYAVIKAGGSYIPIDPDYPLERKKYVLEDSEPKIILLGESDLLSIEELGSVNSTILNLDKEFEFDSSGHQLENPPKIHTENDLVYIMYTSGTTGKPKGVMVKHSNLFNYLQYGKKSYMANGEVCAPLFTSVGFDLTVTTLFLPLCSGGKLVIKEHDVEETIREIFHEDNYSFAKMTPSHLKMAIQERPKQLKNLNTLIVGGEELGTLLAQEILDKFGDHIKIHNEYGPTEATVGSCDFIYPGLEHGQAGRSVSIGKAIDNTKVYILDKNNLCDINVPGELCISGAGVSAGYLNKEELTKEKFMKNPFGEGFIYRTGDLARWLPNGQLEYLGRIDEQFSIRGYRVEPGEIEEVLRQQKGIEDAVVIAKELGEDKTLSAYVVLGIEKELDIFLLKEKLRRELPSYMIPSYITAIEEIPLTINGKVDKSALPDIEYERQEEYIGPRNSIEEILCRIFEEVLDIEQVSIRDNFFELGGDSIKAIRVVSKARELGYEISVSDIMLLHCVENLSKEVKEITVHYEQGEVSGEIDLSPIQKTFIDWDLTNRNHYNQAVMLESKNSLSESVIRDILDVLVKTHDMLRVVLKDNNQIILPMDRSEKYTFKVFDCEDWENLESKIEEESTKIQRTMNLEHGPLMKVALFKTNDRDYLMIAIHHFIMDGVSWRILLEDFVLSYDLAKENKEIALSNKTATYKQWTTALEEYSKGPVLEEEGEYWEEVYNHIPDCQLEKETDLPFKGFGYERFEIDSEITKKLIFESFKAYGTNVDDILLTSLMLAMKKWKAMDDITIDLESHGRNDIMSNIHLDRTLGWFTSIYPIHLQSFESIGVSLVKTKEMLRRVPNLGIGYSLWKYQNPKERNLNSPIAFNYMGDMDLSINEENGFEMSSINPGVTSDEKNELLYDISIDIQKNDNKLFGYVNYKENQFTKESIGDFCRFYTDSIIEVIKHCLTQEETVATPSDFDALDMEIEELEDILNVFS